MARALTLVFLLTTLPLGGATASLYVLVEDGPLADQADVIVRAEILDRRHAQADGYPATYYAAAADELVKGELPSPIFEVRVFGGRSAELGRELILHGAPSFSGGQRVLLFLRANDDGSYRVLHLAQGAFLERDGQDGPVLVRPLEEPRQLVLSAQGDGVELGGPARHPGRFVAWLSDRLADRPRPADYFVATPSDDAPGLQASFTHLSVSRPLRWFEFDAGAEVVWLRHVDGQGGLAGGGKNEFKKALNAWRVQTGAPIRLIDGGTTAATAGFGGSDFQNTILFSDFNDFIADDFNCEVGGVIAVGGVSAFFTQERVYKDETFWAIAEGEIIINDGVGCLLAEEPKLAAQVYAHELGHTLGLGHSCGDHNSPKCSSSELLDNALMRAFTHGRKGADLSDDDVAGARYLYEEGFFAAPCDLPPGHRKFCKRCGPCGEGQGSCNKSSQCLDGMVCNKKVGALFGFKPKRNVCAPPLD